MPSADLTLRSLTLGARDPVTGHCAKHFSETTIQGLIESKGGGRTLSDYGLYSTYPHTLYTDDPISEDDEIKDANGTYYQIETRDEKWITDSFEYYLCKLSKIGEHYDRPATSGTWHLDSDSTITDIRYRVKTWLDTYLSDANILEDDGVALAATVVMFSEPDYSLRRELVDKGMDAIAFVNAAKSTPLHARDKSPYAFEESAQITLCAINKTGITATNLLEQFMQEIRHVATDYPVGSIRQIESSDYITEDLGGLLLYKVQVTIKWKRANDDYTPTYPAFTEGIAFTYEGDRESGGAEGTWTEALGGSTGTIAVDDERNLELACTVFVGDMVTETATAGNNLGIPQTSYPYVRFRYKTSGNAKAKIILTNNDATTQTILAETSSLTWTTVVAALTTGKTVDHIALYLCDGTGYVWYDFLQFYTSTYTLPNLTEMSPPELSKEAVLEIPGMSGDVTQALGTGLMEVTMICDLDMQPWSGAAADSKLSWRRPQSTGTKTDVNVTDVLYETVHLGGASAQYPWVWLDLGDPAMQFKARLVSVKPLLSGEQGMVELVWREYRHGSAEGESASERWGMSL